MNTKRCRGCARLATKKHRATCPVVLPPLAEIPRTLEADVRMLADIAASRRARMKAGAVIALAGSLAFRGHR